MKIGGRLILLLAMVPSVLAAQGVLVAPTTLVIDARARTGAILLTNPSAEPAEIEIGTLFGYTSADSSGQLFLQMVERPDSTLPSAAGWIKAFPRRMVIAPGARQTVRLLVSPPPGIADGEYWARVAITARGGKLPMTAASDTGSFQVSLSLEVRTIIPLLYRKGKVETGVTLSHLRAEKRGDSLEVRGRLERRGNAAMLGTVRGDVVDRNGRIRASFASPMSTYFAMEPRFAASTDSLPPGQYSVRVEVVPARQDLSPDVLLPFRAVRDSVTVIIP